MRSAAVVNDIRRQYRNEADQQEYKEKFDNELAEMIGQKFRHFRGLTNVEQRQFSKLNSFNVKTWSCNNKKKIYLLLSFAIFC